MTMKEYARFKFNPKTKPKTSEEWEACRELQRRFFEHYQLDQKRVPYLQLDSSSLLIGQLAAMADAFGLTADRYDYICLYDKRELERYPYIMLRALYCGPEDYSSEYQTEHKVWQCPDCGKEFKQAIPPLYYNKTEFKGKALASTASGSIIVSEPLKQAIECANLTGAVFSEAYHHNKRMKKEYPSYMMEVEHVLPLLREESLPYRHNLYCSGCHATVLPGSYPRYRRADFAGGFDFYLTREYEGGGWHGERRLIVSQKAFQIICQHQRMVKGGVAGVELLADEC